jgi:hypothetical protein
MVVNWHGVVLMKDSWRACYEKIVLVTMAARHGVVILKVIMKQSGMAFVENCKKKH